MKNKNLKLQLFAEGENNGLSARSYQKEFKNLMKAVFKKLSYFADFFGGGIEVVDGVQENETAFYVKTSDIPVVVGNEYNKAANVAFGTGTANSSRFGNRTEVIYKDVPVNYEWEWTFHEGIDRHTVNNEFEAAVADRLELQSRAKTSRFNVQHGRFISKSAAHEVKISDYSANNVVKLFNELSKYFNNIEAVGTKRAKVNSDLYNAIVDHQLVASSKGSTVNMDDNNIIKFKGFFIQEVPDELFPEGEVAFAYIEGIGKAFTGINTARTIESEDFDGVALQGAGKAGEFILPDNKKAVVKAVLEESSLETLTIEPVEGTSTGTTKLTVSPAKEGNNVYKYKLGQSAEVITYSQNVRTWTAWDGTSDITASEGQIITVVEADSDYAARKTGNATVVVKSE